MVCYVHVTAFKTGLTSSIGMKHLYFLPYVPLPLLHTRYCQAVIPYAMFMTDLNQKEMAHAFFFHPEKMKRLPRDKTILIRPRQIVLDGSKIQSSISSKPPYTKNLKIGIVNATEQVAGEAGYCVLATILGTEERMQEDPPTSRILDLIRRAI